MIWEQFDTCICGDCIYPIRDLKTACRKFPDRDIWSITHFPHSKPVLCAGNGAAFVITKSRNRGHFVRLLPHTWAIVRGWLPNLALFPLSYYGIDRKEPLPKWRPPDILLVLALPATIPSSPSRAYYYAIENTLCFFLFGWFVKRHCRIRSPGNPAFRPVSDIRSKGLSEIIPIIWTIYQASVIQASSASGGLNENVCFHFCYWCFSRSGFAFCSMWISSRLCSHSVLMLIIVDIAQIAWHKFVTLDA